MDLMIDLETLGTRAGAPVITIGAVLFDPLATDTVEGLLSRSFYRAISITEAVNNSDGVAGDTLEWWFRQSDEAIKALVADPIYSTSQALEAFYHYAESRGMGWTAEFFPEHPHLPKVGRVWAKSPDFDCKMMESLWRRFPKWYAWPYRYNQYRCVRTLMDLAWPSGPGGRPIFDVGAKHDARVDAVEQALTVQAGHRALGLSESVQFFNYKVSP
jgi:exodeoxyribonuclease VIII